MLCLIELGRRRVISGHSRDIGYLVILSIWNIGIGWIRKRKWRPGGERLARLCRLRTVRCGSADRGLNCTNRIPGVGGSRNW